MVCTPKCLRLASSLVVVIVNALLVVGSIGGNFAMRDRYSQCDVPITAVELANAPRS